MRENVMPVKREMWRAICVDSVRLWKYRKYNGVEKGSTLGRKGWIFPVLSEAARESVANDNAIPRDDPAEGWYFPAVSPQPLAILSQY